MINLNMERQLKQMMEIQKQIELVNKEILNDLRVFNLKFILGIDANIKVIDEFPNYAVSECGNVYNLNTKKILKPNLTRRYLRIAIKKNDNIKSFAVHILVAKAFIENPEGKPCVDHINNDKNDNRKENLRWVTEQENGRNKADYKNSTSIYKGVNWKKDAKKFQCRIGINKKQIFLGYFTDEKEAARKYNEAAILHFGEFAKLNNI